MSNIDKIRAEIERRREANKRQYQSSAGGMSWQRMCGEEDCLVELLAFLDTLEEPVSEDLEKEIDAYYKEWDGDCRYAQTALHFAQWGAEHPADASKMISKDLEEATEGEWIWATTPPEKPGKYKVQLRYDTYSAIWNGVRWIDDASRFPIMGVFKWKPIKEDEQLWIVASNAHSFMMRVEREIQYLTSVFVSSPEAEKIILLTSNLVSKSQRLSMPVLSGRKNNTPER